MKTKQFTIILLFLIISVFLPGIALAYEDVYVISGLPYSTHATVTEQNMDVYRFTVSQSGQIEVVIRPGSSDEDRKSVV